MEWDALLTAEDRLVIERGGYGQPKGLGRRPALLLIDIQKIYLGADAPLAESLGDWASGGGQQAWEAVRRLPPLVEAFRQRELPVIYTRQGIPEGAEAFDNFVAKTKRDVSRYRRGHPDQAICDLVRPAPQDIVIDKAYASVFYGTPVETYLTGLGVDTLVIAGGSTSGCVWAAATDAVARGYKVALVRDACYDRIKVSHAATLLNFWMKFGDLLTVTEAIAYAERDA